MKTLRPLIISLSLFGLIFMGVDGQETEKKVHLKVVKGGEITVDTVFSASDLENEDLHKKISELAGVDFEMTHEGDMSMHTKHKGEHSYAYVTVDDCEESDGKVKKKIIIKRGEGEEVSVEVTADNEPHMSHEKKDGVYVIVSDDKDGTIIVHKDVKVLKSIGEDGEVIEITVVIKEGEKEKKEKVKEKSKETKQKKEKDRNKK